MLFCIRHLDKKNPKKKHLNFKSGDVSTSWVESPDKEIDNLILLHKESHVCDTAVESQYSSN